MKLGGTTKLFVLLDFSNRTFLFALIAQSVEQRTENPCVAGSIPALGTLKNNDSKSRLYHMRV